MSQNNPLHIWELSQGKLAWELTRYIGEPVGLKSAPRFNVVAIWRSVFRVWVLITLLFCGVAFAGEPVALVTDITGDAWLQGRGKEIKLSILSSIEQDERIRLGGKASITLTIFAPATEYVVHGPARIELTGREFRLSGTGKMEKRSLQPMRADVAGKFSTVQRERWTMAALEMRGGEGGLRLLTPFDVKLLSLQPVFRWHSPQGVKRFVVTLFDDSLNTKIIESMVSEPVWQLPPDVMLQREHEYVWQVRAVPDEGVEQVVSGSFSVIDEARAQLILLQKPPVTGPFSERLLYAVLLDSEGLTVDAAGEWTKLAEERPQDPILARQASRIPQRAR